VQAKKKILVLTDHMPWGHRSIAKAIYGFLKEKKEVETKYAEIKMPFDALNDIYTFAYRFLPVSNKISLRLMENDVARKLYMELIEVESGELNKLVKNFKPDLIISAYFFHSHALAKLRRDKDLKFELWTIIADPWSINPVSFVPEADLNLVYDEVGVKLGKKYHVPASKLLASGWWVRKEMYQKMDRKLARKKLGVTDDQPIIFVGGGSLGTSSLTRLLPVLMVIKQKCTMVFNTGTDKLAYSLVEEYKKILRRLRPNSLVSIKNFGWIENMGEMLEAADIIFGKAGPNFLFDVVAKRKPMVTITHVGGQEDGNIDLIRKKKLGWIKEKPGEAADFLLEYLKNRKSFEKKFEKTVGEEALRNEKTMERLWKKICPAKS
jgi:processive 1,2-diacylglycerol beta-glucosyltransferase